MKSRLVTISTSALLGTVVLIVLALLQSAISLAFCLGESTNTIISYFACGIAGAISGFLCGKSTGEKGLLNGALTGAVLALFCLIFCLIGGGELASFGIIVSRLAILIVLAATGGVIGVNQNRC